MNDDVTALRELGDRLAPDDLEPPARLRAHVLALTRTPPAPPVWYRRPARPLRLAAAAALTGVLALTPALVDRLDDPGTRGVGPAVWGPAPVAGEEDCRTGWTTTVSARLDPLLYLPPAGLVGPPRNHAYRYDTTGCSWPDEGGSWVTYAEDGATIVRHFTVSGPGQVDRLRGRADTGDPTVRSVDVGGRPGRLYFWDGERRGRLYWSLADGTRWEAEAGGLTPDQIVEAARTTGITDGAVSTNVVPAGLQMSGELPLWDFNEIPVLPAAAETRFDWGEGESGAGTTLQVFPYFRGTTLGRAGTVAVPVGGGFGFVRTTDAGATEVTWSPGEWVVAVLTTDRSRPEALAMVRATAKVPPSDPRLR